jgi:DNA-binding CsgD family transcriptional regulator
MPSAAYAILVSASELVSELDPAHAAQMLTEAGQLAWAVGDLARRGEVSRRLAALPKERDVSFVGEQVINGLSGLLRGDTTATAARLRKAADLAGASKEPRALMGAAAGAMFIGDDSRAIDLFSTAVALTRAAAEMARKRDVSTTAQLTPQELQITRFVAEGETNRTIATLMFLSPRTVDYHLRKVFTKLGLSSRAELIRLVMTDAALAGRASTGSG